MFQDKLKELREKANMSQQTLADKLFVSRSAVAKWENGNGVPSDVNLDSICLLFNISKNELFGDEIISEFREAKKAKNKYKKILLISLILTSIMTITIGCFYFVQQHKYQKEYELFKETIRKDLNSPVESFGNVSEMYLDVINSNILYNDVNVFLNENDFYVVTPSKQNMVEIKKYDYEFKEIGKFQLFLHNGYNANIVDVKTLSNNDILVLCNHSTYFNDNQAYFGYSTITKLDNNYNKIWEYTFVNEENEMNSVFEYNNKYYIFSTTSELNGISVNMLDAKICVLSRDGKLEKEENITSNEWGQIVFVKFYNEIFYVHCIAQDENGTIYKIFEYNTNLNCINSYTSDSHWKLSSYKTSNGLAYYDSSALIINGKNIPDKYGKLVLCLNINNEKLLVFKNVVDYDWSNHPKYSSYIPTITQTVYLLVDNNGNILWCKGK